MLFPPLGFHSVYSLTGFGFRIFVPACMLNFTDDMPCFVEDVDVVGAYLIRISASVKLFLIVLFFIGLMPCFLIIAALLTGVDISRDSGVIIVPLALFMQLIT